MTVEIEVGTLVPPGKVQVVGKCCFHGFWIMMQYITVWGQFNNCNQNSVGHAYIGTT